MSSGTLERPTHPEWFEWSAGLQAPDYLRAVYRVSAACSGDDAALGMAMEQSAATLHIAGYVEPASLAEWTVRVCRVSALDQPQAGVVAPYFLRTEVYAGQGARATGQAFEIELAFPLRLLAGKPAQLLNILVGELPRLGFLTSFQLRAADLPAGFGPGPAFGRDGILARFGQASGPLLCRSMRPAVGLDTATMMRLNEDVLTGGFHLVKDDELQVFATNADFREHVKAMIKARDRAIQNGGERKGYLANLICEPDELEARWDIVNELGVDAVLVAPFIQGLGVLSMLARRARLPILAHNTFSDLLVRNTCWGIDDSVLCQWMRVLGADWFVTPGPFAGAGADAALSQRVLQAAGGVMGLKDGMRPMMPIAQGGKHPEGLPSYREAMGQNDFMLIVASWVDGHPAGLIAAARAFREALLT